MSRYKCKICGYIYDDDKENIKFIDLQENFNCLSCTAPISLFEEIENEVEEFSKDELDNAIKISKDNISIERLVEKCINCGMCMNICKEKQGIKDICMGRACINCGQCIQVCPTGALIPKRDKDNLKKAKEDGKILIAYTSPSVRVALGDEFGLEKGEFVQGKLISSLRKIGFDYVLDVTFGADLTIMEEANELVRRINSNEKLPMFTSCCPAWIKYAEMFYPEILSYISTCKSPIGMMGEIVKNYFTMKNNIDKNKVFTVAITPCTAKKYEVARDEIGGTDLVITTRELADILKEENIDFKSLQDSNYDSLLSEGTGSGMIFGNTGGVMEASLREAYYILTGKNLEKTKLEFNSVRGMDNVKEASIKINNIKLNVAVIHKMSSAIPILEEVKNGTSKYHYIEIMNCEGGCIGGGGQPKIINGKEIEVKQKRIQALYNRDKSNKFRFSHENPDVIMVYNEFLGSPLSKKSEGLLHTKYEDKSHLIDSYLLVVK
ncbi:MAG: iron hydrogenase small subunit [Bacilli bacterium]|nr:iron hydrogenase small subunit [Bacilli bacterium]